jgi:hypothetical protein
MASELLRSLFNKDNSEVKEKMSSIGKEALTVGALGYAGYKSFQGSNIVQEVNSKIGSFRSTGSGEFNRVGSSLRRDSMALQELQNAAKTQALADFKNDLQIRTVLESSDASIEDKRALLGSLYDSLKELGSSDLKEIIKSGYNTGNLTSEQIDRLESSYNSYIASNDKFLSKFRRKFAQLDKIKSTLSGRDSSTILNLERQVKMEEFSGLGDSRLAATLKDMGADVNEVRTRYANYVKMAGGADNVSLLGFEDNADKTGIKNLYLRVGNEASSVKVPLYLSRDRNGMVVVRATENLSTRYIAPQRVLNAPEIFNNIDLTSARGGNLYSGKGSYSYEEYIFQRVSKGFGDFGSLNNMSRRDIKNFYEFLRMPGLDAPRGMFTNFSEIQNERGVSLISKQFQENMQFARSVQSARFLIAGLEDFPGEMQQNLVKRLMQMYPEDVRGTGYPIITRVEDPFNRNKTLSFTDVTMARANESAFNVMAPYGRIDEVINEQTARDFQMVGRYELGAGVVGVDKSYRFGKNRTIASVGSGGDLIGINKTASRVHGVNLGAIMLSSNVSQGLGLGEGMSYFGGTLEVKSSINQTVYDDGLTESKLFSTLKSRVGTKNPFLVIGEGGDYSVDQFFKEFGDRQGRAILGLSDEDVAAISRKKGIMNFTLGIVESSFESGRTRSHISGEMVQRLDRTKMFSTILKDTTFGITEAQMQQKLKQAGLSDSEISSFFTDLNVKHNQTLLTTTEQLKKGPQFISSQIAGSLELFGVGRNLYEAEMKKLIGSDDAYLKAINSMTGEAYTSLDSAGALGRKKAYMGASVQAVLNLAETHGLTEADVGRILGGAYDRSGKFLTTSEFETIVQQRLASGARLNSNKTMQEIKRGITFTAHYVSSGGVHTDYARNLAKIEPRFMNYLYSSLRMNFGLDESSATRFLGSFLARQDNIGGRPEALLGMKLTSFSLSQMGNVDFENQIKGISSLKSLSRAEAQELIRLGADEAGVKNFLINRGGASGSILNLEELFTNQTDLKRILDITGGKSKIYLPGASTLENLEGFVVGKSGDNINIENEFTRYITDLNASISGMFDSSGNDVKFGYALSGFKAARGSIAKVSGYALRDALTGRISGSGTYMGQGIVFGKDAASSSLLPTLGGGEQSAIRQGLLDAFNQKRGYVLFQDSQGFLDSMTTFKEATARQLRFDKFANGNEVEIAAEIERRTTEAMRNFYFGMYDKEKKGIFATVQRNPNIYFAHFMPGMEIMRYDFLEGEDDPFIKLISGGPEYDETKFTDEGKAEIKRRKNQLKYEKLKTLYGDKFKFNSFEEYEAAKLSRFEQIVALKERKAELHGILGKTIFETDSEGNRIVDRQRTREKRKFNKITGRYEVVGSELIENSFEYKIESRTDGTNSYIRDVTAVYQEKARIYGELRLARETLHARRADIMGGYVDDGSGGVKLVTETYRVGLASDAEALRTKLTEEIAALRTEAKALEDTDPQKKNLDFQIEKKSKLLDSIQESDLKTKAGESIFVATRTRAERNIATGSYAKRFETELKAAKAVVESVQGRFASASQRIDQAKDNLKRVQREAYEKRINARNIVNNLVKQAAVKYRVNPTDSTLGYNKGLDILDSIRFRMPFSSGFGENIPDFIRGGILELQYSQTDYITRQRERLARLMKQVPNLRLERVSNQPYARHLGVDSDGDSNAKLLTSEGKVVKTDTDILLGENRIIGSEPLIGESTRSSYVDQVNQAFESAKQRLTLKKFEIQQGDPILRKTKNKLNVFEDVFKGNETLFKQAITDYIDLSGDSKYRNTFEEFLIDKGYLKPTGYYVGKGEGKVSYLEHRGLAREPIFNPESPGTFKGGEDVFDLFTKSIVRHGDGEYIFGYGPENDRYTLSGGPDSQDLDVLKTVRKAQNKLKEYDTNREHLEQVESTLRSILGLEMKISPEDSSRRFFQEIEGYGHIEYKGIGITNAIISGALFQNVIETSRQLVAETTQTQAGETIDTLSKTFSELRLNLLGQGTSGKTRYQLSDEIAKAYRLASSFFTEGRVNQNIVREVNDILSRTRDDRVIPYTKKEKEFIAKTKAIIEKREAGIVTREIKPKVKTEIEKRRRSLGDIRARLAALAKEEDSEAKAAKVADLTRAENRAAQRLSSLEGVEEENLQQREAASEERRGNVATKEKRALEKLERRARERARLSFVDKQVEDLFELERRNLPRADDLVSIGDFAQRFKSGTSFEKQLGAFYGLYNKAGLKEAGIFTVGDFIRNKSYRINAFKENMAKRIERGSKSSGIKSNNVIEFFVLRGDLQGEQADELRRSLSSVMSGGISFKDITDKDGSVKRVMTSPEIEAARGQVNDAFAHFESLKEEQAQAKAAYKAKREELIAGRNAQLAAVQTEYDDVVKAKEARLQQLTESLDTLPSKAEYEASRAEFASIKAQLQELYDSDLSRLMADVNKGKTPVLDEAGKPVVIDGRQIFKNRQYEISPEEDAAVRAAVGQEGRKFIETTGNKVGGVNSLFLALQEATESKRIARLEDLKKLDETFGDKQIKYTTAEGEQTTTVREGINKLLMRGLSYHQTYGDVGGGIIYFPQIDVKADLLKEGKQMYDAKGKLLQYESRMDFSRFSIGDFDADIYQVYHDTTNVMRERFKNNAESFHGLYRTGAEFLINMKELGRGMDVYGERMGASSLNIMDFRLDQYEKERILKSVGGLDVQIKVGMLGLAQAAVDEGGAGGEDAMRTYFNRLRAGASLVAVAQESLIIKAKHLQVAADVGVEFLSALKTSYSSGSGEAIFNFFDQNIFKGTAYETGGNVTLGNIEFLNIPEGEASKSLRESLNNVQLNRDSLRETFDVMARTVKERGLHNLGSNSRLHKVLESGDAFSMRQVMSLLASSMEGGFSGDINVDRIEEIMNAQRNLRETVAMNMDIISKRGGGYLAAAAMGAGYLVGVKNSPEVLEAENKFSDMRARESLGGRHLYNMNHKEHANVAPSRFEEPMNTYDRPINLGETMVTRNSSIRMYGEAPTYSEAMMSARKVVGAGGNAFLGIQDGRMPISNSYITKSIRD